MDGDQPKPDKPDKSNKTKKIAKAYKKVSWKIWATVAAVLIVIGGIAWFVHDYSQLKKENERLSDPQQAARDTTDLLVAEVGKLTDLPQGETPTVATVSDISKLKTQAFFKNAQNGDRVLIFTQAKRAYLYRPSTNKIIEIAPLNLGASNPSSGNSTNSSSSTDASSNQ